MPRKATQEHRILQLLQSTWPGEVPALALSRISLQYSRAIFCLRRVGWTISNRVEVRGGVRYGFFRLGSLSVPRSSVLRAQKSEAVTQQNLIDRPGGLFDAAGRYPD